MSMKFPKYNNFICKRCNALYYYSPDYRNAHSLCEFCIEKMNWFWKLIDRYF